MKRFLAVLVTISMLVCLMQVNIYSASTPSLPSANPYPYGMSSLAADQASTNAMLLREWEEWKSKRITSSGAGGYRRVQTSGNQEFTTCSEGMGYGMLLSVYFNERELFDDLYRYAKKYFNAHGLMDWSIDSSGKVVGTGAATDGDEDMATALVFAHKKWGSSGTINYGQEAKNYINNLYTYCVEPGTYILKPGEWGGSTALNPCYFVPAWYRIYADFTGNQEWLKVADKCYALLDQIGKYNNGTGLVPDWCKADGTEQKLVVWNGAAKYEYSYDAARMPWRIALDYSWYGTQKAKEYCSKTNAFFKTVGAANIVDGYSLTGQKLGQYHNPAFVATAASGYLTGSDLNFGQIMFNESVKVKDSEPYDYYGNTLRMLTLLYMSGNFPNLYTTNAGPTISPTSTPTPRPTSIPPTGSPNLKIGAWIGTQPLDSGIKEFNTLQNRKLDIVHMFINWTTNFDWVRSYADAVYANNATLMITWEPWEYDTVAIKNGNADGYIRKMAQDIKAYGKEIWLRPLHEANGNWYPWAIGDSKVNTNDTYIAAFRRIVDIFRSEGTTNVKWVFNTNCNSVGTNASFTGNYPGDAYVDYTSIDGYNWGTTQSWGSTWQTFDQIFAQSYQALKAINKPILIGEWASTEVGGDKARWITESFNTIRTSYDRIFAAIWFSQNKETDWRINSSTSALTAYKNAVSIGSTSPTPTVSPTPTNTPTNPPASLKLSGYINPDFSYASGAAPQVKAGFKVEAVGLGYSKITDGNGYFEITLPAQSTNINLRVSKTNYLTRDINNIALRQNLQISTSENPISIWAGDILISGTQDNAINMSDIMQLAALFNSIPGDGRYDSNADFDKDNSINMTDIMIIAKHFNAVPTSYPALQY